MSEYEVLLERQIILRTSLVVEAASEEEAREKGQDMIEYDEFGTVEELIDLEAVVYLYAADNSIGPSIGYNLPVSRPSEGTLP